MWKYFYIENDVDRVSFKSKVLNVFNWVHIRTIDWLIDWCVFFCGFSSKQDLNCNVPAISTLIPTALGCKEDEDDQEDQNCNFHHAVRCHIYLDSKYAQINL